jgi:hypothetical protein
MSIAFELLAPIVALVFFLGMLALLEVGRRIGLNQVDRHGPDARIGIGVVDGAVYGLLALLIGFCFSGAAGRFDARRAIVSKELNAIGTAWLRIDLLPSEKQNVIRDGFRAYMDALLPSYAHPGPPSQAYLEPPGVTAAQQVIWSNAVAFTLDPSGEKARMLLLPSLNEMFDVVEEERIARRMHSPLIVFFMLGVTAFASALFAGYGIASKSTHNWFFTIGVAATIAMATYVIVELEYPRLGLIRISEMDQALVELRATMK